MSETYKAYFTNETQQDMDLSIEPWANMYSMQPNDVIVLEITNHERRSDNNTYITVYFKGDYTLVYALDNSEVNVIKNNILIDRLSS